MLAVEDIVEDGAEETAEIAAGDTDKLAAVVAADKAGDIDSHSAAVHFGHKDCIVAPELVGNTESELADVAVVDIAARIEYYIDKAQNIVPC